MREKWVVSGVVVLVLGIVFYIYGVNLMNSITQYDVNGIPISSFLMTISEDARNTYELGSIAESLGVVLFIIGLIVAIVGGTLEEKKITPPILQSQVINKSPPVPQGQVTTKSSPVSHDEAQTILRTRYAKGEITKEQYDQMKKDLNN
jgi:hypothetical protein